MILTDSPAIEPNGIPNPAKDRNRIRKRRGSTPTQPSPSRWRTSSQSRIYSAKLFEALRRVRRTDSPPVKPRVRFIREAADRALAVAGGGRTRWSSAILAGQSVRLRNRRIRPAGVGEQRKKVVGLGRRGGRVPAVDRKVKFLGRLVPGCRKLPLPSLLDETSDYIAALEMQVSAMKSLAEKLSGFAGAPAASRPESDSGSPISS